MEKRKWIIVCPVCEKERETDDEYTEKEMNEKKVLVNDSKIISHCRSCLINGKREL
ncbi:hypothetical protein MKZ21_24815 [Paenibacillus sp. FSL P2-0536]|uniref:hypothetical protein n=1 Tax=Paenibacillus TaxID=44249 RepID=UPI000ACF378B|nr:hypothetical protein [Paenibacillus odorifer]